MASRGRFRLLLSITLAAFALPLAVGAWLDERWDPIDEPEPPTCGACGLAALVALVTAPWAAALAFRARAANAAVRVTFALAAALCWMCYGVGGLLLAAEGPGIGYLAMGMASFTFAPVLMTTGWVLDRHWPP